MPTINEQDEIKKKISFGSVSNNEGSLLNSSINSIIGPVYSRRRKVVKVITFILLIAAFVGVASLYRSVKNDRIP